MKAIVAVVLSENRDEGLVRPARRVDDRGGARDAAGLQPPLPGALLPVVRRPVRARLPPVSG